MRGRGSLFIRTAVYRALGNSVTMVTREQCVWTLSLSYPLITIGWMKRYKCECVSSLEFSRSKYHNQDVSLWGADLSSGSRLIRWHIWMTDVSLSWLTASCLCVAFPPSGANNNVSNTAEPPPSATPTLCQRVTRLSGLNVLTSMAGQRSSFSGRVIWNPSMG